MEYWGAASCTQDVCYRRVTRATYVVRASAHDAPEVQRIALNKSESFERKIRAALDFPMVASRLPFGTRTQGKVRDMYDLGSHIVAVTTDRQSAFDRVLAAVPFKGQVLNQTSAWWFNNTTQVVGNALLATPHPRVSVMDKCDVFPVEFVVRGYMTGSTSTSLWTHYKAASKPLQYCGHTFDEGYRKNDRLRENVVTPTTKDKQGDLPISGEEVVARGLMTREHWHEAARIALELFAFGQQRAQENGLILVDTKYELGLAADGQIKLLDEIHTPDSSRYWIADTYPQRQASGLEPENIDKEFLRLWFAANCDPYNDDVLPQAPQDLVVELARRYVYLYERITGETFVPATQEAETPDALAAAVNACLKELGVGSLA